MPLTRLSNSIIDGVTGAEASVAEEVQKYLGTDLVFYRATQPDGLVAKQSALLGPAARVREGERSARASCWPPTSRM